MSNYEKAHPLEVPRALTEVNKAQCLTGVVQARIDIKFQNSNYENAHPLEVPRALMTEVSMHCTGGCFCLRKV